MTPLQRIHLLRRIRAAYTPLIVTIAMCGFIICSRVQRVDAVDTVSDKRSAPTNISQANDTKNPR